jgi:hypothetical protein
MKTPFTRRHFLRSSSACIALPFLESLGFRRFATAAQIAPRPKRMIFLGFGWGVTRETWFPDVKQTGTDYTLPPGLAALARHQKEITVVQGCSNKFSNEAHWGSTFWLTGANRYAQPGQSFANSVSVDQVAAAQIGKDTRFASLQLGMDRGFRLHGMNAANRSRASIIRHRCFIGSFLPTTRRWRNGRPCWHKSAACSICSQAICGG